MAASITLSAVTVDATGFVVTATLAGGSAPYSVGQFATGLELRTSARNRYTFPIASVQISGTTLTITLLHPVGQGEGLLFFVSTSPTSSLSDSAANTAQGQNDLAVTNGSTALVFEALPTTTGGNFEIAQTGALDAQNHMGGLPWLADNTVNGDTYRVEFVAHATHVAVICLANADNRARVDGGAQFTPVGNGWHWQIRSLAADLAAAKHLVQVSPDNFGGVRLYGGNRTLHSVPTTKRMLTTASGTRVGVPAVSEAVKWGGWSVNDATWAVISVAKDFALEFAHTGSGVQVSQVSDVNGNGVVSTVDGTEALRRVTDLENDYNNRYALTTLTKGLGAGSHQLSARWLGNNTIRGFRVINGTVTTGASTAGATTLTVGSTSTLKVDDWIRIGERLKCEWRRITDITGNVITLSSALANAHAVDTTVTSYEAPAAAVTAWSVPRTKMLVTLGDSNSHAWNEYGQSNVADPDGRFFAPYDPRQAPQHIAAADVYEITNLAAQGTTSAQATTAAATVAGFLRGGGTDYVTYWAGTNDNVTPATFKTNVQNAVNTLVPLLRVGGKIILMPPGTPPGMNTSNGLTLAACRQAMVEVAATNPTQVVVALDLFDDLLTADYSDNTSNALHYKRSGREKVAEALAPYLDLASAPVAYIGDVPIVAMYLGDAPISLAVG